ncbi:hypothetical protein SBA6_980006 [Candidatus Sulfopaludibacter sp. SbA6]|nr:hypothetical protein SBA6_980006 [Candidatus Sulfopaludibacter sp. SbA6]
MSEELHSGRASEVVDDILREVSNGHPPEKTEELPVLPADGNR